jgi:hypothetical protein
MSGEGNNGFFRWFLPTRYACILDSSKLLRSEYEGYLYLMRHPLPNVSAKESLESAASD